MSRLILPTAEPFFLPGDETGCLLVHGFTGTPKEMRWLGEYLNAAGRTVLGVRLAGHATSMDHMARMRWPDWLASVEDGICLLSGVTRRIFVLGLSMGGVLSLLAAARYPVDGVVAMSTPYEMQPDWRLRFVRPISAVMPHVSKGAPDWRNPDAARDHVDYPYCPTRSVGELNSLLAEMRAALPSVRVPVLLVHSRQDAGVPPANMDNIYAHLGSSDKTKLWVENSGHVIIREPEREKIFKAALQFITRVRPL